MDEQAGQNPDEDPFKPPAVPTEVHCLHCGRQYDSYLIEWRTRTDADGKERGFWCCPTPGCDGKGFGFDIYPTDPDYVDEEGRLFWSVEDEEDDEEWPPDAEGPDPGDGSDAEGEDEWDGGG